MWRAICRSGFVGVMVMSAATAGGDAVSETALHFSCTSSTQVDTSRLADICADFLDVLKSQPGYLVLDSDGSVPAAAPGLEIDVIRATDIQLELVPTWIARSGTRTTLPSTGTIVVDTDMTKTMRRDLFLRVLASPPQ
ncbi:hypothetical protein [Rhodobacter sp. SY28-1]|uniref:hypothetical protein n=1 Tax=Rhodobacter sp. SY28-1 TaxID=2562317 RepID=UPI0010C14F10|nr:hypothetical protein [Rhodobacter sp. SY28-1]